MEGHYQSHAKGAPLILFEPQRATLHDAFVRLVGEAPE